MKIADHPPLFSSHTLWLCMVVFVWQAFSPFVPFLLFLYDVIVWHIFYCLLWLRILKTLKIGSSLCETTTLFFAWCVVVLFSIVYWLLDSWKRTRLTNDIGHLFENWHITWGPFRFLVRRQVVNSLVVSFHETFSPRLFTEAHLQVFSCHLESACPL